MFDFTLSANSIFYIIIFLFVAEFLLTKTLSFLNTTKWSTKLPEELKEIYDEDKYLKSMEYEKVKYSF
jgi:STE24 endopeptidase